MVQLLDGKKSSKKVLVEVKKEVEAFKKKNIHISFRIILVGDDVGSLAYIRQKLKFCEEVGIHVAVDHFKEKEVNTASLKKLIQKYNMDPKIYGILVQLPLPAHIHSLEVIKEINPLKDVDGFTAENLGEMFLSKEKEKLIPCTPMGVVRLLEFYKIQVEGKEVVILGRSNTAGKPMAVMMINRGATVTICNSKTADIAFHTKRADILIVAIGKAKMIKAAMVKKNAVVIDIGINRLANGKICGDVDFEEVKKKASFITPVPGGVGLMTVACLLENIVKAVKYSTSHS
jgi:methylenetetrahydrofolate dehydrogenase (NADP+)/methenyltetrahydrofolate cyclohydrolase